MKFRVILTPDLMGGKDLCFNPFQLLPDITRPQEEQVEAEVERPAKETASQKFGEGVFYGIVVQSN